MKPFVRYIALCCSVLLVLCGTASCIFDRDYGDPENDGTALFVLHIAPVSTRAATDGVTEKIRSLRIIAISKDDNGNNGVIEINRKVDFNDVESATFGYALTWRTQPGKKDFYIFANEESVENIQFTDNRRPAGLGTNATLGDLLDRYPATPAGTLTSEGTSAKKTEDKTTSGNNAGAADEFKTVINAAYFAPTYKIQEAEGNRRTVYLPYTTVYENVAVAAKKDKGEEGGGSQTAAGESYPMFLVPVATQFTFNFHNYRLDPVEIQKIEVSLTHNQNFLLAQVGPDDYMKKFGNETPSYYWVDWLAKVSAESQKTVGSEEENNTFNETYGWISDYTIPSSATLNSSRLVTSSDLSTPSVPAANKNPDTDEITPSELFIGPFYVPESRNEVQDSGEGVTTTHQEYDLTLGFKGPVDFNLSIGNLRSLFRNTKILIDVTLRAGEIEVYAEMVPWNVKSANGWLTEGNAPSNNPFSAQNK